MSAALVVIDMLNPYGHEDAEPLMESVRGPIALPDREKARTSEDRLDAVAEKASARLHRVIRTMISHPGNSHPFWGFAVDALSPILDSHLKSYVRETITTELQRSGQLQGRVGEG